MAAEAVLTLRPGSSPARLRLDLSLDSVRALPVGAAYTASGDNLRLTATRSPSGIVLEAESDSMAPELTLIERSGARLSKADTRERTDEHKETEREVPRQPMLIVAAVIALLIFMLTIIKQLFK